MTESAQFMYMLYQLHDLINLLIWVSLIFCLITFFAAGAEKNPDERSKFIKMTLKFLLAIIAFRALNCFIPSEEVVDKLIQCGIPF